MDKPFSPTGPTFFLTNAALFIPPQYAGNTLRIANAAAAGTVQGFAWVSGNNTPTYTAPTAGSPTQSVQMQGAATEKFAGLVGGQGVTLIASAATGFYVTPGDGL